MCNGVYGLIAIGDIADDSQISERGLKRILSQYGLKLDARKTGPPTCRTRALVPATRRDVSVPMGGGWRPMWGSRAWGPVPYSGAHVDLETLVRATGRRAGVTEAMGVWRDPEQPFTNTGAEAEAPAMADARPVVVFVPPPRCAAPSPRPNAEAGERGPIEANRK
jgi:hypothetical protein